MRYLWILLTLVISSCVVVPNYQYINGGVRVTQPGVTFILPKTKSWVAILRSTYEAAFGANRMPRHESLIVATRVYNMPSVSNKQDFLEYITQKRESGPKTGRFEKIRNQQALYPDRTEMCIVHQSASKDFGREAKRGGDYSVFETYGMNCRHPLKPQVGIFFELSRKAPPATDFPEFETMAQNLLKSVKFVGF